MKGIIKSIIILTCVFFIVTLVVAFLFNLGSNNWSASYWAKTFYWIAPCVFSFIVGMLAELNYFALTGNIQNNVSRMSTSFTYGFVILITSLLRDINRDAGFWFEKTFIWFIISIVGFYIGMSVVKLFNVFFKKTISEESNEPVDSKAKNDDSVSIIYTQQSVKDRMQDAEIQDGEFRESFVKTKVAANPTSVAEAAAQFPEVQKKSKVILVDRDSYFGE